MLRKFEVQLDLENSEEHAENIEGSWIFQAAVRKSRFAPVAREQYLHKHLGCLPDHNPPSPHTRFASPTRV